MLSMELDHVRNSIRRQLQGALTMLRQCVEVCPAQVWTSGTPDRPFWRIAYHAAHYAHLYACRDLKAFVPWEKHYDGVDELWDGPPALEPFSQADILEYIDWVHSNAGALLAEADLVSQETGFHWYPNMSKLDHLILNVRHAQGHVGQRRYVVGHPPLTVADR